MDYPRYSEPDRGVSLPYFLMASLHRPTIFSISGSATCDIPCLDTFGKACVFFCFCFGPTKKIFREDENGSIRGKIYRRC